MSSEFKTSIDHNYVDSYPIMKCASFKLLKPESMKDISKGHVTISKADITISPRQSQLFRVETKKGSIVP